MIRILKFSLVLISIAITLFAFKRHNTGTLALTINQIKPLEGAIRILMFNGKEGWPNDPTKAVYIKSITVDQSEINLEIKDLKYGDYAIAVLHDINLNEKADKSIIGIPTEPFGFSNYPKITFGVPDFEEVSFTFNKPTKRLLIEMKEI
jgi:uncharacterized protein (DUF2141 family)